MAFLPLIGPVFGVVDTVLKRVLPAERMSETDREKLSVEMQKELMAADWREVAAQLAINTKEAEHPSTWVAGWRPYIGWVCGTALGYNFIAQPFLTFGVLVASWMRSPMGTPFPPLPLLDITDLITILLGMLGLGGLRTMEKKWGVSR